MEFAREGSDGLEWSLDHIEKAIDASGERVIGFSRTAPTVQWREIFKKLTTEVPIAEIKRMNITYVEYQFFEESPAPVFIVNVFGHDALPASSCGSTDAKWARTRFIFDANGELLRCDNCL